MSPKAAANLGSHHGYLRRHSPPPFSYVPSLGIDNASLMAWIDWNDFMISSNEACIVSPHIVYYYIILLFRQLNKILIHSDNLEYATA